jgi:hypothetical protein
MRQLFGGILLAMGILIAGASGLCSLAVLFGGGLSQSLGMLPLVLLIGGLPFALGIAMTIGGRRLLRSPQTQDVDLGKTFE